MFKGVKIIVWVLLFIAIMTIDERSNMVFFLILLLYWGGF